MLLASLILFFGICPVSYAANEDRPGGRENKVVILKDGTKLTYIYGQANIERAYWEYIDRLRSNQDRNFSLAGNLSIKTGATVACGLLCLASTKMQGYPYVSIGLQAASVIFAGIVFFYPEYVRYDVDQVENHRMPVDGGPGHMIHSMGLLGMVKGFSDHMPPQYQYPHRPELYFENGIIIVERSESAWKTGIIKSGVYPQWEDYAPGYPSQDFTNVRWYLERELNGTLHTGGYGG